jgi:hypothetical protein
LPQRANQLGNGKGQRSGPGRFRHVGQGYLPLGPARARSLLCGNLQSICLGRTGIDLDLYLHRSNRGRRTIGLRERATVEPPAGKLDPQAIEERR